MLNEFKAFAMRGNVVDLAVGFILGGAFSTIVTSFVNDILMPPIGLALGGVDFSNLFLALDGADYASLAAAREAGAATINYGLFVNAVISFVIIAFALFLLVRAMNRLAAVGKAEEAEAEKPEAPAKPADVALLEEIRDLLAKRPE
ncbi:MAG: large conductance mechanosensitive channel protein MscL [Alphaproteobacteria bacterium]|nr:large conductance mechanosensitive channel protein MscL [Alphaproteobacteria bacterium]